MAHLTPLERIEAAEKAATPGPWLVAPDASGLPTVFDCAYSDTDCELLALLRNHAADLIAVARAAQKLVAGRAYVVHTGQLGNAADENAKGMAIVVALAPLLTETEQA